MDSMIIAVSQDEEEDLSEDKECEKALTATAIIGGVEIAREIGMSHEAAQPLSLIVVR